MENNVKNDVECPAPCSLSYLLSLSCKARSDCVTRRLKEQKFENAHAKTVVAGVNSYTCRGSSEYRSNSLDEDQLNLVYKKEFENLLPLHVVTSEPVITTRFSKQTMCEAINEQDSDVHYDFGLATSPDIDENMKNSIASPKECCEENIKNEKPESGCVTSFTSPILDSSKTVHLLSNSDDYPTEEDTSKTSDVDLEVVRQLLVSSKLKSIHSYEDLNKPISLGDKLKPDFMGIVKGTNSLKFSYSGGESSSSNGLLSSDEEGSSKYDEENISQNEHISSYSLPPLSSYQILSNQEGSFESSEKQVLTKKSRQLKRKPKKSRVDASHEVISSESRESSVDEKDFKMTYFSDASCREVLPEEDGDDDDSMALLPNDNIADDTRRYVGIASPEKESNAKDVNAYQDYSQNKFRDPGTVEFSLKVNIQNCEWNPDLTSIGTNEEQKLDKGDHMNIFNNVEARGTDINISPLKNENSYVNDNEFAKSKNNDSKVDHSNKSLKCSEQVMSSYLSLDSSYQESCQYLKSHNNECQFNETVPGFSKHELAGDGCGVLSIDNTLDCVQSVENNQDDLLDSKCDIEMSKTDRGVKYINRNETLTQSTDRKVFNNNKTESIKFPTTMVNKIMGDYSGNSLGKQTSVTNQNFEDGNANGSEAASGFSTTNTEINKEQQKKLCNDQIIDHISNRIEKIGLNETKTFQNNECNPFLIQRTHANSENTCEDSVECDSLNLENACGVDETCEHYNGYECNDLLHEIDSDESIEKSHEENTQTSCIDEVSVEQEECESLTEGRFKNIHKYSEKMRSSSKDEDDYCNEPTEVIMVNYNEPDELPTDEICKENAKTDNTELAEEVMKLVAEEENNEEDDSNNFDQERQLRIKRSSSLKYAKTPPGTPGTKKIVRFADCLGLDLADIRTFLDGIPNVPPSAFCDLEVDEESDSERDALPTYTSYSAAASAAAAVLQRHANRVLTPMFQQPGSLPNFMNHLRDQRLSLENVTVDTDLSVKGIVRVVNESFHKKVYIRYTFDHWKNFHEISASYVDGSSDGFSDRFSFLLWGSFLQTNGSLVFCVKYCTNDHVYWDNNHGSNYTLKCYSAEPGSCENYKNEVGNLYGRPQNHGNMEDHRNRSEQQYIPPNYSSFLDTPTTPSDPWISKFF